MVSMQHEVAAHGAGSLGEIRRAWLPLVTAFIGVATGYASLSAHTQGAFMLPLTREFGWTRAEISVTAMIMGGVGLPASLALTGKEYALIEYLASRQGHVVGRVELAEHVWDENFDPFSNTIEVHIGRLRKKIETDGSSPLLITRRGEGYVLDGEKPDR